MVGFVKLRSNGLPLRSFFNVRFSTFQFGPRGAPVFVGFLRKHRRTRLGGSRPSSWPLAPPRLSSILRTLLKTPDTAAEVFQRKSHPFDIFSNRKILLSHPLLQRALDLALFDRLTLFVLPFSTCERKANLHEIPPSIKRDRH